MIDSCDSYRQVIQLDDTQIMGGWMNGLMDGWMDGAQWIAHLASSKLSGRPYFKEIS